MSDDMAYDQAVHDCFMGESMRDCANCIASPAYGGRCCFGELYDIGDKECRDCLHRTECSQVYHGSVAPQRSVRLSLHRPIVGGPTINTGARRIPIGPRPVATPTRNTTNLIPTAVHRTPPVLVKEEQQTQEPFFRRLGRVTGWGMIEGGLQMALNFFQRNRPE
jgi:hypothetical protein